MQSCNEVICKFTRLSITVPSCNDSCVHPPLLKSCTSSNDDIAFPYTFGLASSGPDSSLSSFSAASPSWKSWPRQLKNSSSQPSLLVSMHTGTPVASYI